MNIRYAISILLLVAALLLEEIHNMFSDFSTAKVNWFPLNSNSKMSLQWYVHDFGNVLSVALVAVVLYISFKQFGKNMRDIGIIYLFYRLAEIPAFLLWNNQFGYSVALAIVGLSFYLIGSKWKNN